MFFFECMIHMYNSFTNIHEAQFENYDLLNSYDALNSYGEFFGL